TTATLDRSTPQFATPTHWKLRDCFLPSVASGNAYDNAAAETVMGLFKNEAVAKGSPFRTGALKTEYDVVELVFDWVHWYNNARLHSALGHQTPEEYEQTYYHENSGSLPGAAAHKTAA
ncbi:integrase core domain-containing protein, partial [Arthrobacter cryoconiti]